VVEIYTIDSVVSARLLYRSVLKRVFRMFDGMRLGGGRQDGQRVFATSWPDCFHIEKLLALSCQKNEIVVVATTEKDSDFKVGQGTTSIVTSRAWLG